MENTVTKREKFSYGMYFMGQNVFYGLIGYMTTYFTDVGITAAWVAVVALITKVWDAINDPIFGMIMDKVHFKKGKFLPWLRMSVIAIPVSTILLFRDPYGHPVGGQGHLGDPCLYAVGYSLYALRCADFWHCHYNDA